MFHHLIIINLSFLIFSQYKVIHGTTGTGRSGIYACIDAQIKRIKKYADVNVYESVFDVRQNRYDGVKTLDEYIFIHDSVLEWILKKKIKEIDVEYLPHYIENINKSAPDSKYRKVDTSISHSLRNLRLLSQSIEEK